MFKVKYHFCMFKDDSNTSIVYTRWGKKACPAHAELIHSGDLIIFTTTTINYEYFKDSLFFCVLDISRLKINEQSNEKVVYAVRLHRYEIKPNIIIKHTCRLYRWILD